MHPPITNPVELRQLGFKTLVAGLGWGNAVRFIQQYESGQHNYTDDRDQILPDWDPVTMVERARKLRESSG
jgi:hypothetical protein